MIKTIKKNINPFKSVFILGGTSEIAQEICLNLIHKGTKKIHLVSRDNKKNSSFINKITSNYDLEITHENFDLLQDDFSHIPNVGFYDLYIIAAGYLGDSILANNDIHEAIKIAQVNYIGLIRWISAITSSERVNHKGVMWILTSVAGDRGRPSNYHYGAAKAALSIFCEGLLNRFYNKPFKIRIIKAGFISTKMSYLKAPKLLSVNIKYVAKTLTRRPYKEGIEYLPFWWFFVMRLIKILPRSIVRKL